MAFRPPSGIANELILAFDIRPSSPNGYIAHVRVGSVYEYLVLDNGHLVLTFDLGTGPGIIKSKTKLENSGIWYSVTAIRKGKNGQSSNA